MPIIKSKHRVPLRWEHRALALPRVQVDELLVAARHLPQRERALLDGVYRRGMSVAMIAQATGMSADRLRRRLRGIVRRLRGPLFRYALRECMIDVDARARPQQAQPVREPSQRSPSSSPSRPMPRVTAAQRRAIARHIVLERRPQRIVADQLNLTLHQVRSELARLRALAEQG